MSTADDTARAVLADFDHDFEDYRDERQNHIDLAVALRALLSTPTADPPTQTASDLEGQGDAPTGIVTDEMVERGHEAAQRIADSARDGS